MIVWTKGDWSVCQPFPSLEQSGCNSYSFGAARPPPRMRAVEVCRESLAIACQGKVTAEGPRACPLAPRASRAEAGLPCSPTLRSLSLAKTEVLEHKMAPAGELRGLSSWGATLACLLSACHFSRRIRTTVTLLYYNLSIDILEHQMVLINVFSVNALFMYGGNISYVVTCATCEGNFQTQQPSVTTLRTGKGDQNTRPC